MNLNDWIGRSETVADTVTATPYAALSATLDRPADRPAPGAPLPPLWHWLYFLPLHRQSEIGPDGHAMRGGHFQLHGQLRVVEHHVTRERFHILVFRIGGGEFSRIDLRR